MTETASVYRCYDTDGVLLYVGCSTNLTNRMRVHRCKSPWFDASVRVEAHEYPERWQAQCVEQFLISLLRPRHNKHRPWGTEAYRLREKFRPSQAVAS